MAAEDLTAPPVLKVHTVANLSGKLPSATPSRAGPPRNMGHSAARAPLAHKHSRAHPVAQRNASIKVTALICNKEYPPGKPTAQTKILTRIISLRRGSPLRAYHSYAPASCSPACRSVSKTAMAPANVSGTSQAISKSEQSEHFATFRELRD